MIHHKLKEELSCFLKGNVVIVGIGNQLRSDDGFGPALIKRLAGKINATCIDAGQSPENYIGKIIKLKPDTIIFLDVVSMHASPAAVQLIHIDRIPEYGFSTHNMSPKLMIENIAVHSNARILMIGVEPRTVEFGERISDDIMATISSLEEMFIEILGKQ